MYKKILLPTDGSKNAEIAAEHAFILGSKSNAEITVLNVVETPRFMGIRSVDKDKLVDSLKKEGEKSFDRIKDMLMQCKSDGKCEEGVNLNFESKKGSAADVILKTIEEEDIDLVVMGSSGKGGMDRILLGSVAENTVRSAKVPVLVARYFKSELMYRKILIPTDGSEHANKALKHAIWIAGLSGAELIALNVAGIKEIVKKEGRRSLEKVSKLVEESRTEGEEEIKLTMVMEEGYPADIIVKKIKEENIDLVVIGSSGKHGLGRILLGSVARHVVRLAPCHVLVIP
ncbi:MAG: universal stress protein [Methanobacterium sp.]|jgi:nucleotide-binding universal stress UspA family protein